MQSGNKPDRDHLHYWSPSSAYRPGLTTDTAFGNCDYLHNATHYMDGRMVAVTF